MAAQQTLLNRGTRAIAKSVRAARTAVLPYWRMQGIGVMRMVFGLVWGVDAWFKWQPSVAAEPDPAFVAMLHHQLAEAFSRTSGSARPLHTLRTTRPHS
jgi:hypothetical protein